MIKLQSASKITAVLLFIAFGIFFQNELRKVVLNKNKCVCAYDGFGYYMYLPHLLQNGNLEMTQEWAQKAQNEYCDSLQAYQIVNSKHGGPINVYHMGQAYIEAPSFFIGHIFAKIFGYKIDGFSKPYHLAFILNALLFILLGLIYFRKLSLLFFSENITSILLILGFVGTNYWVTATLSYSLQHLYLFALISAFGYYFFKSIQGAELNRKAFIISTILFGLCTVIRPTHVLIGVIPGIFLLQRFGFSKKFWKLVLWFPLFAFVWNIPQLLYWKLIGGNWVILNLHTEDITLFDPYTWKFLFSYRKGWLIYTPVFLLLLPAFWMIYKKKRDFLWPFLAFTLLFIWVFSSWECWWYMHSFGQRPMVDLYPLLLLPLGFLLQFIQSKIAKISTGIFIGGTVVLCMFQSWQVNQGILPTDLMTERYYWSIFGKTDKANLDHHLLLINRSDITWVERFKAINDPNQRIETFTWYALPRPITIKPHSDFSIVHLPFFGKLKTDETRLEVVVECNTSDTTKAVNLQLESAGKYNCYDWESIELSNGLNSGENTIIRVFNIEDVRHNDDYLQVYIQNPTDATVRVKKINIKATSVIRK